MYRFFVFIGAFLAFTIPTICVIGFKVKHDGAEATVQNLTDLLEPKKMKTGGRLLYFYSNT